MEDHQKQEIGKKEKLIRSHYRFPWIGMLAMLAATTYFFFYTNDYFADIPRIPAEFRDYHIRHALFAIVLLAAFLEWLKYRRYKLQIRQELKVLDEKLTELLQSKHRLQNKVQRYADNANKLKLFISDRLLEYIEYDEKYLHFKNIASEIRHNGVISYDKVNTALTAALAADKENANAGQYRDGLNAMSYLWDLLDLSTTDNIALYIANKLYDFEELYYRQFLNKQTTPISPVFDSRQAAHRALAVFVNETGHQLPALPGSNEPFQYIDERYWIYLEAAQHLLGNENYIFLIIENLVSNGEFYTNNRKYGHKYSRIAFQLSLHNGRNIMQVYNAGPHIEKENKDQIFQLGFSTKRSKGHRGRGLGLYFVHQIVTGYEGKIGFKNISNKPDTYVLRVELEGGGKLNEIIETRLDEERKPLCRTKKEKTLNGELTFRFDQPVKNIEIAVQSSKHHFSETLTGNQSITLLDPENPMHPQWVLEIQNLKTTNKVIFKPLDIRGVCFRLELPTAESRLDPEYHDSDTQDDDLGDLDENYRDNDPYVS